MYIWICPVKSQIIQQNENKVVKLSCWTYQSTENTQLDYVIFLDAIQSSDLHGKLCF